MKSISVKSFPFPAFYRVLIELTINDSPTILSCAAHTTHRVVARTQLCVHTARALLKCSSFFLGADLLQDLSRGSIAHSKLAALVAQQRKAIDHALKCECQTTCSHTDTYPHELVLRPVASLHLSDTVKLIRPNCLIWYAIRPKPVVSLGDRLSLN